MKDSAHFELGEEAWMNHLFEPSGKVRVKILQNEFKVKDNAGNGLREVHAYKVEEVGGKSRKWPLVPETQLHREL